MSDTDVREEPCPKLSEEEEHEGHFFDLPFDHGRAHCPGYVKTERHPPPERYQEKYPEMICPADRKHGWHRWFVEGSGTADDMYLCPGLPHWGAGRERHSDLVDRRRRDWETGKVIEPEQPREGDQPLPIPNDRASMHDLVVADMLARKDVGYKRYGALLQAFNGRDGLRDLYEELLDAIVYVRQVIEEDDERRGQIIALQAELERLAREVALARSLNRRLQAEKDGLQQVLDDARRTMSRMQLQLDEMRPSD